jgi:hypothetical protein
VARPKVKIDLSELEKLATLQCTEEEIAAYLGISARTLQRRLKVANFGDIVERARAKGRVSVRRNLFRLANSGNIAAAIFLSKNLLGYRDVVNTQHTGMAGGPIQIAARPDLSQLTDEELNQLRAITDKTLPPERH